MAADEARAIAAAYASAASDYQYSVLLGEQLARRQYHRTLLAMQMQAINRPYVLVPRHRNIANNAMDDKIPNNNGWYWR